MNLNRAGKAKLPPLSLVSLSGAGAIDRAAMDEWGFNTFALVESAGRKAAGVLVKTFPDFFRSAPHITVLAGSGNNGADAMALLRALILEGCAESASSEVFISRLPSPDGPDPRSQVYVSLAKMGTPCRAWIKGAQIEDGGVIIDGVTGAGLNGPLRGAALEMVEAVNSRKKAAVVSIDIPSGCFDGWEPGMPMVEAGAVLAIEPLKACLYTPAARPRCGAILPVTGIFPPALTVNARGPGLYGWKEAQALIPPVPPAAYKYERGLVEIRAGSPGAAGAARIAARGAQAAGAGLVRLVVDPSIHAILAAEAGGIMVVPDSGVPAENGRFVPDAVLLGPGWGRGKDRERLLEHALEKEEQGTPLVLDADAVALAGQRTFHGKTILTPHPGEFAAWTGIDRDEVLAHPLPLLSRIAAEKNAVILFKSHVLYIASCDGRTGVVDGMIPSLGTGGAGDLLAGFCAALAARGARSGAFDGFAAALASASLLIETAASVKPRFIDPLELAGKAAGIAGRAWLPGGEERP
ncbi:MAG: bifunctional ADP-dependent NAD(P)H-hydrate dehydratase/NAD(P)H-hydrate epimerase [Treponema sp.]|nr:bifunctional ADP-dependent NAD(P)H-hydrate dehydratase/NAD(P)H-hydrate epimerase [Treponema sp.]